MPTLDRITIYPVKSLDGVDVEEGRVMPSGGLENDRRWRLVDLEGRVVNAKRTARFHLIRAEFDLAERLITLSRWADDPSEPAETFPLVPGPEGPCGWLSEALGVRVLLEERHDGGFPDDREAAGPTLLATASLEEVARWFGFDLAEARRRFRANLEIGGCDAFWEDTLASPARPVPPPSLVELPGEVAVDPYADVPPEEPREFSIGEVRFRATNVCRRCVVPGRDSRTGAVTERFREAFEA
ncbi:MAG: MOSC domain-containing protein, partial [Planctomycetia bacterium]